MTTTVNFERRRGDGYPIELTLPADVTGGTFLLTADPSPAPVDATNNIFQLTGNITSASSSESTIKFDLDEEHWDIAPGRYYYDIQMTLAGIPYTVAVGTITIKQDITK